MFFGDSICFGQGVAIHRGWVTQVSAAVSEADPPRARPVVVTNASINGNTTRMALERMPYDVQSHGVDVLLVQFGMNDCNHWDSDRGLPRVSPNAFAANLEEIFARGRTFGAARILVNTNHPTTRDTERLPQSDTTYEENNRRYNEIIRRVCSAHDDVTLNDIENVFVQECRDRSIPLRDLLLPDLLHLSEQGHDLYFKTVYPRLAEAVEDATRRAT